MLKIIQDMKSKTSSWNDIHTRICELPESVSFYCRYTYGELVKAALFNDEYFMRYTPSQINTFNSRFNQLELSLIRQIGSTNNAQKLNSIEMSVKSFTQRTQRTIESVALDREHEEEIEQLKSKHKSKRLNTNENTMADSWRRLQAIF